VRVLSVAGYSYDAAVLDEWPLASYTRGALNAAGGLIIGHTSKDGTSPFYASSPIANATADEWAAAMSRRWGAAAPRVTARYSLERFAPHASNAPPAVTSSYVQADADERVACPLRTMATLAARHVPVFTFVFSQLSTACDAGFELKVLPWWTPRTKLVGSGWASHGAENHFLFGTSHGADSLADPPFPRQDCPLVGAEAALSTHMGERWAAFARGEDAWWRFAVAGSNATRTAQLQADVPWAPLDDFKSADCAFWDVQAEAASLVESAGTGSQ
jgi:carboxylesterase type B